MKRTVEEVVQRARELGVNADVALKILMKGEHMKPTKRGRGRPKLEIKRDITVATVLTETEFGMLQSLAGDLSISKYLRHLIEKAYIEQNFDIEELESYDK